MNCSRCQSVNPDGAKFCMNCGLALAAPCPNCGTELPALAKFCFNCGHQLAGESQPTAAPVPERRAPSPPLAPASTPQPHLQQYIPQALLAKLEAARAAGGMAGERRTLTILFCDIKGSTAMAEALDPEEWSEIMNGAFQYLIQPVYRYEGMVARLMGDAILAFFGAPIAHEDDPQRAILTGLDILQGVRPYCLKLKQERGLDFHVRVGINTGLVVVGAVGSDLRLEYTAMGDTVNLAARMEQTAQPGTVQIAHDTYKMVAPLFDVEPLGSIEVKGHSEPVLSYRVIGPKAQPGRLRGIEGLDAPLVGRDREMAMLREVMSELQRGRGQIVGLIGEAGLGKSRLIAEFKAEWDRVKEEGGRLKNEGKNPSAFSLQPPPTGGTSFWSESRGVSYDTTRPYGQIQQQLRHLAGILEMDPPEVERQKIARQLQGLPAAEAGRAQRALEMLLIGQEKGPPERLAGQGSLAPGDEGHSLSGEAVRRELFEVIINFWRARLTGVQSCFVLDDLHWADTASVELLTHLFQLTDEVPIFFLCAFRPDRQAPSWQLKVTAETDYPHRYHELTLSPLSDKESDTLVNSLLSVADLPSSLRRLILDKAEGNPFFVEEVVRELIDSGAVVRDEAGEGPGAPPAHWRLMKPVEQIDIPDNLQSLLTARIDRLEEAARQTLQLAAVIGRTFYYRVLKLISQTEAELDRQLHTLQRLELIREAARVPELEYMFRHALTQEAAYRSILRKRRRQFHRRVGETMAILFADRPDEFASLLAYHFYEAGDNKQALKYYTVAGDNAYRLYANPEAASDYGRALQAAVGQAADLPIADAALLQHLYLRRGRALELVLRFTEAVANYEEMAAVARRQGDRGLELAGLMAQATIHSTPTAVQDPEQAQKLSEKALAAAHETGDRPAEAKILWNLLLLNSNIGRPQQAIAFGEASLAIARQLKLSEQMAYSLNDLSGAYIDVGQLQQARVALEEARGLWRHLDNKPLLADNLGRAGQLNFMLGNIAEARQATEEAYRIGVSTDNLWGQGFSLFNMSFIDFETGEIGVAIEAMETSISLIKRVGAFVAPMPQAYLGMCYAFLGAHERAAELGQMAHTALQAGKLSPWIRAVGLGNLARIAIAAGDLDVAEASLTQIDMLETSALTFEAVGPVEAELALARQEYGRLERLTEAALTKLRASGARVFMPEILYLRGKAALGLGHYEAASEFLLKARAEAEAMGLRRILWLILLAQSQVERARGAMTRATELAEEARQAAHYLAGRISQPELKAAFLSKVSSSTMAP